MCKAILKRNDMCKRELHCTRILDIFIWRILASHSLYGIFIVSPYPSVYLPIFDFAKRFLVCDCLGVKIYNAVKE